MPAHPITTQTKWWKTEFFLIGLNKFSIIISTNEDPSLRIESSAIINLRGVPTKLN